MIGGNRVYHEIVQIVTTIGLQQHPTIWRDAGLFESGHATRRRGEATMGIATRDHREGIRIEVIRVFVGQKDPIGLDRFRAHCRERETLEPVQPLAGIGQVRVKKDPPSGGGAESKPGLAQPVKSYPAGGNRRLVKITNDV